MAQSADDCNDAEVLGVMAPSVLTGQVPVPPPKTTSICKNTQCAVDTHTGPRCPACYGRPS